MAVSLRPEEMGKKVLVKAVPTYGFQKELGENFRISLTTNRSGGVLVPFKLYAESFMDPDLEFYDPETGERLGTYIPPADGRTQEVSGLLKSIRELIISNQDEKSELVNSLKTILDNNSTKKENTKLCDDEEINQILELPWKERMSVVKKIDSLEILQKMRDILKSKSSLGKTNREVLRHINEKIEELEESGE